MWPAIWLMPRSNVYGTWPSSGEIDLVEGRGNRRLFEGEVNVGTHQVGSTLHFGPRWDLNGYPFTNFVRNSETTGFNEDFHEYTLIWSPDSITFLLDDVEVGQVNVTPENTFWDIGRFQERGGNRDNPWKRATPLAPFDQEFYLIINLAVGGVNFFGDHLVNEPAPKPWTNNSPHAMLDFWNGRSGWMPTWETETDDTHLQVDYVKIYAF